jgi:hypothetical protein
MLFVGTPQDKGGCEQYTLLARTERWYSKRNCSLFAHACMCVCAHQEGMRPATLEFGTLRLFYQMRSFESCGRNGLHSWQFRFHVL